MGREYIFKDHQATLLERAVTVRMEDDQVFTILPPELWPDDVLRNATDDPLTAAEGILEGGKAAYAAYTAAGGNAMTLVDIFQNAFGASLPESSASSSS